LKPKPVLIYILPIVIVILLFSIWYFKRRAATVTDSRLMLGTFVEITAMGESRDELERAVESAFLRISEIEAVADRYTKNSEISKLNLMAKRGGVGEIPVSDDIIEMLDLAGEVSERSNGAFDVTIAPVVDLWDFSPDGRGVGGRVPDKGKIGERLRLVDYRSVVIEKDNNTVSLRKAGIKLDLGGIAKGYAVDEAVKVLRKLGVESGVINAGGDMAVIGYKGGYKGGHKGGGNNGGTPWRIGIQDPRNPNGLIAVLSLNDVSVVTSGDYERYFIKGGKRYHHIVDPKTGYPSEAAISVTVIAKNTALADTLATAIFVLGPEMGIRLAEDFAGKTDDGGNSVEAMIVGPDGKFYETGGFKDIVEYLD